MARTEKDPKSARKKSLSAPTKRPKTAARTASQNRSQPKSRPSAAKTAPTSSQLLKKVAGLDKVNKKLRATIAANAALNATLEQRAITRTAEVLEREYRIRAVLDATVDAIVTIDSKGIIETFNRSAEKMFGYTEAEAVGKDVSILMPSPYREKHGEYIRRYQSSREPHVIGKTRKLTARRKDGTEFPIQLSLAEIDHLARFTGIISDITEQQTLQEDVLRIAALEQRRIGQELHDSTQQALTGLGLLAEHLSETLSESGSPQKALAAKLAAGIADVGKALRSLARGLLPGPINAGALTSALAELARSTVELGIPCHFKCPAPIRAPDDMMATHLYRIAQEAVTNAVKHSQATTISIELVNGRSDLTLRVTDDGVGIRQRDTQGKGLGLRIMRYRCALIGGDLAIRQREAGGTAVICTLPSVAA